MQEKFRQKLYLMNMVRLPDFLRWNSEEIVGNIQDEYDEEESYIKENGQSILSMVGCR